MTKAEKRFLANSIPVQSPTRIAAAAEPATPGAKAQPPLNARQMHEQIVADYKAKHGTPPELDFVMKEVWRRLGFSAMSARQKKQFSE